MKCKYCGSEDTWGTLMERGVKEYKEHHPEDKVEHSLTPFQIVQNFENRSEEVHLDLCFKCGRVSLIKKTSEGK